MNADGPQRHLVNAQIDTPIEQAVNFIQTQESPAELSAPAASSAAPRNPAWNIT